ncbi:MAG: flagellar hook-basal body complex protein [Betaproteobacteria bacterium]|nr:flagellar hook-basal body complex protein [Betaproteobacteria bacterium]
MSSGFSIGLNALQANAGAIEVASKNIAASNVSGFKSSEYLFQEALSRSIQPTSSGRFGSIGTGGITRRSYAAGSSKYSASPLDMSINGDGMFVVGLFKEPSAEKTFYTRSGNFLTDKDGFLVSSSGLFLYGYQPNIDATNVTNVVGPLKEPESPMPPNPTSEAFVAVNLDARLPIVDKTKTIAGGATVANDLDVNYPDTYSHVQQFSLFDKLGRQHSVSLYFRRDEEKIYNVYVNVDGQVWANPTEVDQGKVAIKMPNAPADGQSTTSASPQPVAKFSFTEGRLGGVAVGDQAINDSNGNLSMTFVLSPPEDEGEPLDPSLVLSDPIEFKLDFNGTTNYASAFEVKRVQQDGYGAGSLSGLSVDDRGILRGQFTNGRTVVAGQLQLATFRGLGGLREVTNNTYQATEQSGDALVGTGAAGIFGSVRSNSIEEANTDMASELVRLMVQQRNYQANAQTIRTQVEILSVTIDVTR